MPDLLRTNTAISAGQGRLAEGYLFVITDKSRADGGIEARPAGPGGACPQACPLPTFAVRRSFSERKARIGHCGGFAKGSTRQGKCHCPANGRCGVFPGRTCLAGDWRPAEGGFHSVGGLCARSEKTPVRVRCRAWSGKKFVRISDIMTGRNGRRNVRRTGMTERAFRPRGAVFLVTHKGERPE